MPSSSVPDSRLVPITCLVVHTGAYHMGNSDMFLFNGDIVGYICEDIANQVIVPIIDLHV